MPREFSRHQRVAILIKQEIATLLQRDSDMRHYGLFGISHVQVYADLSHATIHVTCLNTDIKNSLVNELNDKANHYRHKLATVMVSKRVPKITFKYDEAIATENRINQLLATHKHKDHEST